MISRPVFFRTIFSAALLSAALFSAALIAGTSQGGAADTPPVAESTPVTGKYCLITGPGFRLLALKEHEDGLLDFDITIWFNNGQRCAMGGTAQKNPQGGWVYEENLDSKEKFEHCRLFIKDVEGTIHLDVDQDALCRSYCGGGVMIYGITFPPKTKESNRAAPSLFEQDELDGPGCQPPPQDDL